MRFQDRVVIVTGGAKGIGRGCIEVFLREGAFASAWDRDASALARLVRELTPAYSDRLQTLQVDVAEPQQIRDAMEQVLTRFGALHCLVNNAGVHPPDTPIEQMPTEEAMRVMQINFASTYACSYHALRHLRATRGTIVNISSMTAVLGQKNSTAYAASKGAQVSFTKSLALETATDGVRVNAILPSNVDTPLMRDWAATLPDPNAALDRIAKLQPLGRMASPEEIGKVCLFLATEDSSFLTGQAIEADGGAALDY
jgi:NAD(P)-dependent dehydrogenase (short-subunit alcohol dehydrogenase family)